MPPLTKTKNNKQQQQVVILPEGYSRTQKRDAQQNNIMAAQLVSETIRTTLGPKGMDKMLVDGNGTVVITNDGVTILKEMAIEHPAAKMIVEVARTQEEEVGDGTTTAVVIAGALLKKAEDLLEQKIHPTVITKGYTMASRKAIELLTEMSTEIDTKDEEVLLKLTKTCISTKAPAESKQLIKLLVDATVKIKGEDTLDIGNIKLQKKVGKSVNDSELISGLIIDKERVNINMPKTVKDAKIALISNAFEIEKTEVEAKININSPEQLNAECARGRTLRLL